MEARAHPRRQTWELSWALDARSCNSFAPHDSEEHARFIARCVLHRASVYKDAANPSFRRASVVDVSLESSLPLPRKPPPLPGTACAAAAAPAQ